MKNEWCHFFYYNTQDNKSEHGRCLRNYGKQTQIVWHQPVLVRKVKGTIRTQYNIQLIQNWKTSSHLIAV